MDGTVLIPIVTAVITGLLSYLAAARKMSGQIKTTTADKLWEEAHDVRQALREQLEERDAEIAQLKIKINECTEQSSALREDIRQLIEKNDTLREEVDRLVGQVKALTDGGKNA